MTEEDYLTELMVRCGAGGDWIPLLEEALRAYPNSWELWLTRGRYIRFHGCGDGQYLQLAQDAFQRATEVAPETPEPWVALGEFHKGLGNTIESEKCFREAARLKGILEARRPSSKFALFEVVRICSQPPDRRSLIGELGTISVKDLTKSSTNSCRRMHGPPVGSSKCICLSVQP